MTTDYRKKRPPEFYWLPKDDANGECYHARMCSAHTIEPVERETAVARVRIRGLEPCGICVEHHGLEPIHD